jgi:hypothetical protein
VQSLIKCGVITPLRPSTQYDEVCGFCDFAAAVPKVSPGQKASDVHLAVGKLIDLVIAIAGHQPLILTKIMIDPPVTEEE